MKRLTIIVVSLAIICLCVAVYFILSKFIVLSPSIIAEPPTSTVSLSPTQSETALCQKNQLRGVISAQGAAGNIYATLELTNVGKTICDVQLGNSIAAIITGTNIDTDYQQTNPEETFSLAPFAKVYSQIHYPNGPQCQSGIAPEPISFVYKAGKISIPFQTSPQTGKLLVQACKSQTEKTTIDIWPLSKTPSTP